MKFHEKILVIFLIFLPSICLALSFKEDVRILFWDVESAALQRSVALLAKDEMTKILRNEFGVIVLDRSHIEKIMAERVLHGVVVEDLVGYHKLLGSEYALVAKLNERMVLTISLISIVTGETEMVRTLTFRDETNVPYLRLQLESIYSYLSQPIRNPSDAIKLKVSLDPVEIPRGERLKIIVESNVPHVYLFSATTDGKLQFVYQLTENFAVLSAEAELPKGKNISEEYLVAVALARESHLLKQIKHIDELDNYLKKNFRNFEWQIAFAKYIILGGDAK